MRNLTTTRLTLSAPTVQDIPDIVDACNDPAVLRLLGIKERPYTPLMAEGYIASAAAGALAGTRHTWAIRLDGRFIGQISIADDGDGHSATIGYWMSDAHRGKGYLPEAGRMVLAYALDVWGLGFERVFWHARVSNAASSTVAQKLGFRLVGLLPPGALPWNPDEQAYEAVVERSERPLPQVWDMTQVRELAPAL